jgi:hypothetical protein
MFAGKDNAQNSPMPMAASPRTKSLTNIVEMRNDNTAEFTMMVSTKKKHPK